VAHFLCPSISLIHPSLPPYPSTLGVDPLTSNSLQAKYLYKWEDVRWHSISPLPPSLPPSLGVDPLTSNSLQAKYSYKWEDVRWRSSFAPCLFARHFDGGCVLDVARFHQTQRVG